MASDYSSFFAEERADGSGGDVALTAKPPASSLCDVSLVSLANNSPSANNPQHPDRRHVRPGASWPRKALSRFITRGFLAKVVQKIPGSVGFVLYDDPKVTLYSTQQRSKANQVDKILGN